MRRILLPVFAGLFGLLLTTSCESEMPSMDSDPVEVNKWIFTTLKSNYLFWTAKDSASLNYGIQPPEFFGGLKSGSDNIASLAKISNINSQESYDIGFEYGINNYRGDNVTYYVVYYTRKGTFADNNIRRGDNIIAVNGTSVTEQNSKTLLAEAIAEGGTVKLSYMRPPQSEPIEVDFPLMSSDNALVVNEDPVYAVTDTVMGSLRVGYIAYNRFTSEHKTQLLNALTQLKSKNINYFVLDLRYNPGGFLPIFETLGSALVKNRTTGDPFLVYKRREDIGDRQISLSNVSSIPNLGDQLAKIYIITGQYTASASEAFINALKAYWGNNLILVGEKTTAGDNNNIAIVPTADKTNQWQLTVPIGYMADKDGNSNYANGFTPTGKYLVNDINPEEVEALRPLGVTSERIYKVIIDDIRGVRALKSATITTDSYKIPSSIMSKPWANKAIAE
ncbi:MAG TPA: hypothetical protein DIT04_10540 [Dysgonomonas sp.]|nr:hypothetical protein [Dysgonomonas sp.]